MSLVCQPRLISLASLGAYQKSRDYLQDPFETARTSADDRYELDEIIKAPLNLDLFIDWVTYGLLPELR